MGTGERAVGPARLRERTCRRERPRKGVPGKMNPGTPWVLNDLQCPRTVSVLVVVTYVMVSATGSSESVVVSG